MSHNSENDAFATVVPAKEAYNYKAIETLVKAIRAKKWTQTAVQYGEICLTIGNPDHFTNSWDDLDIRAFPPDLNNLPYVALYTFGGSGDPNCLPVGDNIVTAKLPPPYKEPPPSPMFYLSPSSAAPPDSMGPALMHPIGFTPLVSDRGSKNKRDITYWQPIAPPGYHALGICFNREKPSITNYWCVRSDLCTATDTVRVWQEHGWDGSGSVETPVVRPDAWKECPEDYILLSPLAYTYYSVQAFLLRVPVALLDVEPFDFPSPEQPKMDPKVVSGQKLPAGLSPVVIVPFTAIPTDRKNTPDQAFTSPFYFVAAQPYYYCFKSFPAVGGATETVRYHVGVTKEDSATFEKSTSITTNVEVGAVFEGPTGSASLSMTNTFSLSKHTSHTEETSVEYSMELTFPPTARVWQWQLLTDLMVMRCDGTYIKPIAYMNNDQINIPPPEASDPPEPEPPESRV